ncbi:hypothetical protein FLL45_11260 [Aliikangiella marina]|uniref:CBU-0592-like domain-containing protein n=1 Tax=Aliikangiella marina TaxID=1712262 RepID=A0A545TE39_9GAMM|nr:hypothetical protein FLL45_11260 [Aliikangiella marina]
MDYSLFDLIGNVGVALIIWGYFLLQIEKVSAHNLLYLNANLVGAVLIIISLSNSFNLSAFVIEVFWVVISLYGIFKTLRVDKKESTQQSDT